MRKIPMRTCVMCRKKTDKRELLRIVRTPQGDVVFDPTGKQNGRGAYVCSDDSCLNSVKNVKKVSAALDVTAKAEQLEEVLKKIREYLDEKRV